MALSTYNAYLNGVAQKPVKYWRNLMQATVNNDWDNASTIESLQGQVELGSKAYAAEELRLMSVIDPKTGNALGDDYRKIIYKDFFANRLPPSVIPASQFLVSSVGGVELYKLVTIDGEEYFVRSSSRFLGKYYQFDGETWLTINTNTRIGASISAILQRCNNTLKWFDSNGILHSWACVFQRTLSGTGFDYGSEGVPEIGADVVIKVQRNSETEAIPFNQRFIFDGHAFQVRQINNHISDTYMELYIFEIQVQSNDDVVNDIANTNGEVLPTTNAIRILPELTKILQGTSQTFSVYNYVDGVPNSDTFNITVSGAVAGVNYTLSILDGNNFRITNILESNEPLTITCVSKTNPSDVVVDNILLGGIW